MGNNFAGFDDAFADFFDAQREGGNLSKSFGAVAPKGIVKSDYAVHASVDLGNIADLRQKR